MLTQDLSSRAANWDRLKAITSVAYSIFTETKPQVSDPATSNKSSSAMGLGKKLAIGAAATAAAGYTAYSLGLGTTHFPLPSAITDTISATAATAGGYMSSAAASIGAYIPTCVSKTASTVCSHLPSASSTAMMLGAGALCHVAGRVKGFDCGRAFAGMDAKQRDAEFEERVEKKATAIHLGRA